MRTRDVLVFLLLAPSVIADCPEGSCPTESDQAEFMQRAAATRLLSKGVNKFSKEMQLERHALTVTPKLINDMLSQMRNTAKKVSADGSLPPSEQANVETIKTLVEQNLLAALHTTRDDAQKDIHNSISAVEQCIANSTSKQQSLASGVGAEVSAARTSHATCRNAEDPLYQDKTTKCQDLEVFVTGITDSPGGAVLPQAAAGDTPDSTAMGEYLQKMEYFCGKHKVFTTKKDACENATTVLDNKTAECDVLQTLFEADFCMWRVELIDLCTAAKTCYDAAEAAAYKLRNHVAKKVVPQLKVEYEGLKKILCYVNIWMSDNDVQTVDKSFLDCDKKIIDTSPMDINFPAVPPPVACDETPVSDYPCTSAFVSTEYGHLPHTKACNAPAMCTAGAFSDSGTTTTTTTPTPATCTCTNPGDKNPNQNQYTCDDGTVAYCTHLQFCYTDVPFAYGDWAKACADTAAATNLVVGGGFEEPVCQGWNNGGMCHPSYASAPQSPPGWTVTSGNVDWGKYQVGGHCTSNCNPEGEQSVDLCGSTSGSLQQVVDGITSGSYLLSYMINAHASCGGKTKKMNVYVDDALLVTEEYVRDHGWADIGQTWESKQHVVQASGSMMKLDFESGTTSCGCMLLDDVKLMKLVY
eukprot:gnl/TRDRNA2_/TRDRNA2_154227_c1_seq2.p1 gnl/TRDRNA2_/TRDRNA2_154227_c1~~gnl/TRDRNA2_/TRDRNA2_154227_c1_seq2.p1  ORF type:complete len:639 (-),score=95.05 gnl/TRDRNA2_/TRDRNA2_154227_c1_seq2:333-2249(-)